MKCVCGYKRFEEFETFAIEREIEEFGTFENGDKKFFESTNEIRFKKDEPDYYSDGKEDFTIYACPKCGTLKIDI